MNQREAFEAWAKKRKMWLDRYGKEYNYPPTETAWQAWQDALASQWRTIETAPAGESILIYQPKFNRVSMAINDGFEWKHATHWMPLPSEPTK